MALIQFIKDKEVKYDGYLGDLLDQSALVPHKYNGSIVGIITGKSGLGKSTLALQCAKRWNPKEVYVAYSPEDFLKGLSEGKPGSTHIYDEAMPISNRSALSQTNRLIIQAMSMIRSKRLFVLFNVNAIWDLDRNLVLSRADFLLHVYGNPADRGKLCAFYKAADDKIDRLKLLYILGKQLYDYSKPKANFYASFRKAFLIDEVQYEASKQIAVNDFLNQNDKGSLGKNETGYKKLLAKVLLYGKDHCGMKYIDVAKALDENEKKLSHTVVWARDLGFLEQQEGIKE